MATKEQIGVRVDPDALARLDAIAEKMAQAASAEMKRSDAARSALMLGIEALEQKFNIAPKGGRARKS